METITVKDDTWINYGQEAYESENYLHVSIGIEKEKVFKFAKLRISNHQLKIEQGRYKKIPPENRFC